MTPAAFISARKLIGITQAETAAAFGVTRETICRIERGKIIPPLYALALHGLASSITSAWWMTKKPA